MHWAAHGQTAAEKIFYSADSSKPNMGLHSFSGSHPTQSDALVAKNYCTEDELLALNDIVSAYLDLAEMQAADAFLCICQTGSTRWMASSNSPNTKF